MLNFTGFCTYPLGGYVTAALIVSTMAAVTTTIYATISCRFVVLTFSTTLTNDDENGGGFEGYFSNQRRSSTSGGDFEDNNSTTTMTDTADAVATVAYRTSLGLYQWLRPLQDEEEDSDTTTTTSTATITDWTVGTCVGYQETMLLAMQSGNILFDLSRIMAIFAILLGLFQFCWMFTSSCISMNRIQLYLFLLLSICGTTFTGLTFLFYKSYICTTGFDNSAYCQIDQGGLVMIASIIFWCITFMISIYYVIPVVMVVSSTDSVDFELHKTRTPEEKQKLALQREIYKELRRQQKEQRAQRKEDAKAAAAVVDSKKGELPLFLAPTKPKDGEERASSSFRREQQLQPQSSNMYKQQERQSTHPTIRNSYSYDSKDSWLRPIAKRSSNEKNRQRHERSMSMEDVPTSANLSVPQQSCQPIGATRLPRTEHDQQRNSNRNNNDNNNDSPSRFMIRTPSLSRMRSSDRKKPSSLSNIVIVETNETGDIEMQPDAIQFPTTRTTTVPAPAPTAKNIPTEADVLPQQQQRHHSKMEQASVATTETQPLSEPPQRNNPTELSRSTKMRPEKNPLDVYIAQRLDNIEMLTR